MQQKNWLTIVFSILMLTALGCSKLPPKPAVFLCTIRLEDAVLLCAKPDSEEKKEIALAEADKYIAFSPADWLAVSNYIKEIKSIVEKKCRQP